jgi:hypothetical protein
MAVIFSYPIKSTPDNDDLILISDGTDKLTKQVRVSTLPGGSSAGVSSFNTLTGAVTITGGTNVTLNTVGNNIEINASGGGTFSVQDSGGSAVTGIDTLNFNTDIAVVTTPGSSTATVNVSGTVPGGNANNQIQYKNGNAFAASANLTFSTDTLTVKDNVIIRGDGTTNAGKLRLECYDNVNTHYIDLIGPDHGGGAASYSVKFPATGPANAQMILQSDASGVLSWINTPSSGGGGAVDSVNTTDGTFIDLTPNSATTGAVTVTADLSATGTAGNTTFLRGDNQWAVPVGTTYSAGTGLALNTNTFSLAANAALTNLGGGSGSTFLQKDGTWATPTSTNTNIGGNNLTLTNNRTLDFYSDTSDKSLTFISTISGTKTLFKFDTVLNKPRLTIGDTASTHEGTLDIKGNGSNRTGKINLYNAAGTYSINIQAPTTFGSNYDIPYVLPNTQGAANTFLQNNGSGTLTWSTASLDDLSDVSFATGANGSLYVGQISSAPATGLGNVTLGGGSGKVMSSGADNTLIGSDSASLLTEGADNVVVGSDSAAALTTGIENVVIGSDVAATLSTGSGNVVIGKGANTSSATGRSVVIGEGASANNKSIAIGQGVTVGTQELGIGEIALSTTGYEGQTYYLPIKIKNSSGNMIQYYIKLWT